jgi:hypothetical protein
MALGNRGRDANDNEIVELANLQRHGDTQSRMDAQLACTVHPGYQLGTLDP